jgi:hypothetical protein
MTTTPDAKNIKADILGISANLRRERERYAIARGEKSRAKSWEKIRAWENCLISLGRDWCQLTGNTAIDF